MHQCSGLQGSGFASAGGHRHRAADDVRASIRQQYAAIEQSRAQAAAARVKAAHDAAEVARCVPLAASKAEARERLAQLRATAIQFANNARAQLADVAAQQRRIDTLRRRRAKLQPADVDVSATSIRAPDKRRIDNQTVIVSQYAQTGTRSMSLVPLDRLHIVANLKKTQIGLTRSVSERRSASTRSAVCSCAGASSACRRAPSRSSVVAPAERHGQIHQDRPARDRCISVEAGSEAIGLLVLGLSLTMTVDTISVKGAEDRIATEQKRLRQQGH